MARRRRKNLSTGAKDALAITGMVLVPVTLAALGIYGITKLVKKTAGQD